MAYIRVPPDSTGKKVYSQQHTVGADTVEAQVIHLADPQNPTYIQKIDYRGAADIRFSEGQPALSGFGAITVSDKKALGVYESSSGSYDDLFSIEVAVGGTNTYDDVGHGQLLTTSTSSGSSVKRTSNRYHYYLPGSSNEYIASIACGDSGKSGNTRSWGMYDDDDGIFFSLVGTVLNVCIRSSTSGSVVNTLIPQSSWNADKLDGSGASAFTIDITKLNLFWFDYQWLGAGRVRFGVYDIDGTRIVAHLVGNAGANALPYTRSGTLPVRTENVNTGATGSVSQLRESCIAVYTHGHISDYTFWRSSDIDATATALVTNTLVVAIRSLLVPPGLNHHNSIIAYPETLNVYTDQPVRIDLQQSVTVTGGTWGVTTGETSIEASTDTTLSAEVKPFKTWFFGPGAHTLELSSMFELNDEGIMLNADDTPEVWAFVAKRLGATNAIVTINLGYRELW